MERKIGEVFTYNGKLYQVVKFTTCIDCAFRGRVCSLLKLYIGQCASNTRSDKTSVIFKLINNMEIKNNQLTIDIPEGYEIDKENSTFECIKFKPIEKYLTYKEIAEKLNKDICFFIEKGKIQSYAQYASYDNPDVANSYRQIEKILAINQLMNIANYYNKGWKPDWKNPDSLKFYIWYDTLKEKYDIEFCGGSVRNDVYFKNKKDAQAVIDNPNFRSILNAIYKD